MIADDTSKIALLKLAVFLCKPSEWSDQSTILSEGIPTAILSSRESRAAYEHWLANYNGVTRLSIDAAFLRSLNDTDFRRATELVIRQGDFLQRLALRLAAAINQNSLRSAILKTERQRIQELYGADLSNFALRQAPTLARDLAGLVTTEHEPLKQGLSLIGAMLRSYHIALSEIFNLRFPGAPAFEGTLSDRQLRSAWLVASFEGA